MDITIILQTAVIGILVGGVYGLLSMGLALIYGVMKVLNLAQGDFMMLGMYAAFFLFPVLYQNPILLLAVVIPTFFAIGILVEYVAIRPVVSKTESSQLLMTLGLSIVLQNVALIVWGPNFKSIQSGYSSTSFQIGPFYFYEAQTIAFVLSIIIATILSLLVYKTEFGRTMRSVSDDRNTAELLGVNVHRVYSIAFGIGIALAAGAGVVLALYYPVFPSVGFNFLIIMYLAVMLGGLGNIGGSLVAGLILGVVQSMLSLVIPQQLTLLPVYFLFLAALMLQRRFRR